MLKEKQSTTQNKKNTPPKEEETSLQDILASIRGIIEDKPPKPQTIKKEENTNAKTGQPAAKNDNSVLELTDIFSSDDENDTLISSNTKRSYISTIEKFTDQLGRIDPQITHSNVTNSPEALDNIINELMRPMLKEWLNNNLPRLVEKVVSEEIRQLMKKK
ncbi:MAG: DUF2497 domain-containing protein [Rickettsiaceae bacterium]|nr:DUF2497 domain-containing protein [Rickettsiaceae bacterium]